MPLISIIQIFIGLATVLVLVKPLGWYMAQVLEGKPCGLNHVFYPIERGIYRFCQINPEEEMGWRKYLFCTLLLNFFGCLLVYGIQRIQSFLPLNPQAFSNIPPYLAFNTAISFMTNTNWQAYVGENTMSYGTQMLALTVQNFLSAATGIALFIAFCRGLIRHEAHTLGNFWQDIIRSVLYILLPMAFLLAFILVSQGVIQNFKSYEKITLLAPFETRLPKEALKETSEKESATIATTTAKTATTTERSSTSSVHSISEQIIPMGPVASQIAIKQLGSNGGGFFNANSSHPFENPNTITHFFELLAILLIPAALCYTLGKMVNDTRQGWALLITMGIIFIPLLIACIALEYRGNPQLSQLNPSLSSQTLHNDLSTESTIPNGSNINAGILMGNLEGKETRFGITSSVFWIIASTATSNGSVNAMLDSFLPLAGLIPLAFIQLGEIICGGVGMGLLGMIILAIITVFLAGLMIGKTPEYLGKKIEPYEMKMAAFAILIVPITILIATAVAVHTPLGKNAMGNPNPHGFTEILYAFSSMSHNNGSAMAGLNANNTFYNIIGGLCMLIGRFWIIIPVLSIAGSLARKKSVPNSSTTLPTHRLLFILLLVGVIFIFGALTFLPALALGPIAEQLISVVQP